MYGRVGNGNKPQFVARKLLSGQPSPAPSARRALPFPLFTLLILPVSLPLYFNKTVHKGALSIMRMRNKPWAGPELRPALFYTQPPTAARRMARLSPATATRFIWSSVAAKAFFHCRSSSSKPWYQPFGHRPERCCTGTGKKKIEPHLTVRPLTMWPLTAFDIERLALITNERDIVERIYINFCNPWPRPRHKKRRLTYPTRLAEYIKTAFTRRRAMV